MLVKLQVERGRPGKTQAVLASIQEQRVEDAYMELLKINRSAKVHYTKKATRSMPVEEFDRETPFRPSSLRQQLTTEDADVELLLRASTPTGQRQSTTQIKQLDQHQERTPICLRQNFTASTFRKLCWEN